MDTHLRAFFDRFHKILGFETQDQRDAMVFKLEDSLVRRAMARFMAGLTPTEQSRYEEFLRNHPKSKDEEVAAFLRALRPGFDFTELFNDEARILTVEYVKKVLLTATEEQKQQIKTVFQEMFHIGKS